jgi:uncharacterized protein DUF3631
LEKGALPDTLVSRSITIKLKRKLPTEEVQRYRQRNVEAGAEALREAARSLSDHHVERLRDARPALPDELRDRAQDVWEPLLAVADLAGDEWPATARNAALTLSGIRENEESHGVRLLRDIGKVFDDRPSADRISTADLIETLAAFEESPWGEWWWNYQDGKPKPGSPRRLAKMVHAFDIASESIRIDDWSGKGYMRSAFTDAWTRFLPASPQDEDGPQPEPDVADVADVAAQGGGEGEIDPRLYCSRTCLERGCWKPNGDGWEVGCLAAEEEATA